MSVDPPELPPRAVSPAASTISASWHGQQECASVPLGCSTSVSSGGMTSGVTVAVATPSKTPDKVIIFMLGERLLLLTISLKIQLLSHFYFSRTSLRLST